MIAYIPLVAAVAACLALLLPSVDDGANLVVTRIAMLVFGEYVGEDGPRRRRQRDLLRAAHIAGTHRAYAAKTLLYAAVLGVAGSVIGVYAAAGLLSALEVTEATLRATLPASLGFVAGLTRLTSLQLPELFLLLTLASATLGSALSIGVYYGRWELLNQRAHARGTEIDATLPRTVAFMYALSRSGMPFPRVMDTLAKNEAVYGEAATELSVAVRDMNAFGTDALTALQRTSRRTPSEDLADFAENLASVLGTGQSISTFLNDQYELYQEEAEAKQQRYLELLSTFAEAYVTALVAGPLFFITILVVIGLVLEDTLPLLRAVVYVAVPLATFGFVVYVDSVTQGVGGTESVNLSKLADTDSEADRDAGTIPLGDGAKADGGVAHDAATDPWHASRERLQLFDRIRWLRQWAASPVESVLAAPRSVFLLTVPLALGGLLVTAFPITLGPPTAMVAQVERPIVVATALVLASYAIVYEIRKRRVRKIEAAVPDFLDRFASVNEAGTSVVGSLRRVAKSNLEALSEDLQRTRRDIDWGADVGTALRRLELRVRSPMTSRAVALITNAMRASGDVAPVLRIAADESRATWALRRERQQVMVTYLIVIYISFLVFLGIIASLSVSFIPAIEDAAMSGASAGTESLPGTPNAPGGITEGLGDINATAYEQLFFHAASIQAICSGLVAGQLGEGSVRDGVKHVVVLLLLTLAVFLVINAL
ncbi:type II secretion system F family protein [Halorubrum sp. PV6]|uniref:type II secretion system F family protein n=1 Tax=Halorubrum sp. PV6 TaxID=634157 RepID=UPI000F857E28|nr:type II secretion system F family protein [Halorubrum sp. PV6]AZQ14323.1 secretion system protein [Halorubrum sp. PV6]